MTEILVPCVAVAGQRVKGVWCTTTVETVCGWVESCRRHLDLVLIALGGRHAPGNVQIFDRCTHAVVLARRFWRGGSSIASRSGGKGPGAAALGGALGPAASQTDPLVSLVPMEHVHRQPETGEGIVERGHALYERDILPGLDPGTRGKFLAVDVDTGDYEVDSDELVALKRLRDRRPEARLYLLRVGFPAAYRIGARAHDPAGCTPGG